MGIKDFYLPEFVRCPLCGAALVREGGSLFCTGERRHTYDIAREGYVNLLPPGRAKNARTGDGADMIRARERFLAGGGYDRYSREAAQFAAGFLCGDGLTPSVFADGKSTSLGEGGYRDPVLIDSGCGEGRHTVNMAETFSRVLMERYSRRSQSTEAARSCDISEVSGEAVPSHACPGLRAAGFDASKYGVQAAAKRYVRSSRGSQSTEAARSCDMLEVSGEVSRDLPVGASRPAAKRYVRDGAASSGAMRASLPTDDEFPKNRYFFAAANIFSMPVADGCADIFTSLFAPLPDDEVRRVLRPGGILVICAAGANHLHEMREILYDVPVPSGGGAAVPAGFTTLGEKMIEYPLELGSREEIDLLFTMTPFYHNAPPEGRARLAAKESLIVTVQVKCTVAAR